MEPVMKEDYSQVYKKYYSRLDVLFEIVKCLGGRETSLLQPKDVDTKSYPVRCIKAHNVLFYLKRTWMPIHFMIGVIIYIILWQS